MVLTVTRNDLFLHMRIAQLKCVCLYKTQFEGPQLSKHLMNSCYLPGTAIDAGFQEGNQSPCPLIRTAK